MDAVIRALQRMDLPRLDPAEAGQEAEPVQEWDGPVPTRASPNPNVPARARPGPTAPARNSGGVDVGTQVQLALMRWLSDAPTGEMAGRTHAASRIRLASRSRGEPVELDLEGLGLTSLPACMQHLRGVASLDISNNDLTSLGPLPPNLLALSASRNSLTALPALPEGLVSLEVFCNYLTDLPALPTGLGMLDASRNRLTRVANIAHPEFGLPPELESFDLRWNPLEKCPVFPASLSDFALSTHEMRDTTYLQQISGYRARDFKDTHVLGERQETLPFQWVLTLPDYQ